MRTKFFFVSMIVFSILTLAKYREITYIKSNSKEFTFIIEGEENEVLDLKYSIQNITYQHVCKEKIEKGKYKIRLRYPPEKMNSIWFLLSGVKHSEIKQ
jgi:hypothetical protein